MRILFVHQNFPGQYVHIIQRLAQQGQHQMVALGINALDRDRGIPESLNHFRYRLDRGNTKGVHPLVMETETKIIRAEGCARAAERLGVEQVVIDVRTRQDAENADYSEAISGAGLIYLSGGNPKHLARTLIDTPVWEAIHRAWRQGASLAGCSAGAMALSGYVPDIRHPRSGGQDGLGRMGGRAVGGQ